MIRSFSAAVSALSFFPARPAQTPHRNSPPGSLHESELEQNTGSAPESGLLLFRNTSYQVYGE
jgi:hypothetical protein